MATLLRRPLTASEEMMQSSVRKVIKESALPVRPSHLFGALDHSHMDLFFPAVMSLIDSPPTSGLHRSLCAYLVDLPGFLDYIGDPDHFSREDLLEICRVLIKIAPRLDVALVSALSTGKEASREIHNPTFLRILDVLDDLSPGGRLVMSLTRLMRDLHPDLESKAALSLGRRVRNPAALARQLTSSDPRVRANCVEALWGSSTSAALKLFRETLTDHHHRVAGNAAMGLWIARASDGSAHFLEMLKDSRPMFRQTAAWAIGKTGDPLFEKPLTEALSDEDDHHLRAAIERALERCTPAAIPEPAVETTEPVETAEVMVEGPAEIAIEPLPEPEPAFELHLNGSFTSRRK